MTTDVAIILFRKALLTALLVAAPMLVSGLVVGLVVSILQAVTQVHEMTLTFIPKIVVVVLALLICMPWMTNVMIGFTRDVFVSVGPVAR